MAGEKLNTLQIPYPDFRVADIIEPEEFDANNKALQGKVNTVVAQLNAFLLSVAPNTAGNSYYTKPEIESLVDVGAGSVNWLDGGSFYDSYVRPVTVDGGSFAEDLSSVLVYNGGAF